MLSINKKWESDDALCLHQILEKQVCSKPNATALSFENTLVTYRELNESANKLANYLRDRGVKPHDLVGVCVDRSPQIVVCILAILKAGAAYVPLDPNYPQERLLYMLRDSGTKLLLTQKGISFKFDEYKNEIFYLDSDDEKLSSYSSSNPLNVSKPDDCAYVIYTSGSTGQPKGVLVTHRNVIRLFTSTENLFGFTDNDVWTLFHSYAFDFSVWEIWGALLSGGRLVIVPYWVSRTPVEFYRLLFNEKVTVLNQTPSAFSQLVDVERVEESSSDLSLRYIIFGGEKLNVQSLKPWLDKHGDVKPQLINMYGITETTVHVTFKRISLDDLNNYVNSVGHPLPDLEVFIVNNKLQPVSKGEIGEILVGGAGVAEGYLNLSDVTKEKFIRLPNLTSHKLYRSGDLGSYLGNGEIEYIGRSDRQVKVRGFRIELGEIENVLLKHPSISAAVVSTRKGEQGEIYIVGYVVPLSGEKILKSELRDYLLKKIPGHMVPHSYIFINSIPLTPNGKVDYNDLEELYGKYIAECNFDYQKPTNELEETLCQIWSELLCLPRVGIDDSFFELGGHSLLAVKLVWMVKERMGISIPLQSIFIHSTIREIVRYELTISKDDMVMSQNDKIKKRKDITKFPISHAQKGIWFQEQFNPGNTAYNMILPIKINGKLKIEALQKGFSTVIKRHETLRSTFKNVRGLPVQFVDETEEFDLNPEVVYSNDNLKELLQEIYETTIDLENGPLIKVRLLCLNEAEHVLVVVLHHIVGDAISLQNLFREVITVYESIVNHRQYTLPEISIQYADYAAWQSDWLDSKGCQEQLAYWRSHLKGASNYLSLDTDFSRLAEQSFEGESIEFEVSEEMCVKIRDFAKKERVTLYMLFMATWNVLLNHYSNQSDINVGTSASCRNPDTDSLIGLFVNTLPIRTIINDDITFRNLCNQVKKTVLDAFSNQNIPYEHLLSSLKVTRNPSYPPLCQVFLSYQILYEEKPQCSGLEFIPMDNELSMVPYDITVEIYDDLKTISGSFQYFKSLFKEHTIQSMINDYLRLLALCVEDPHLEIRQLKNLMKMEGGRTSYL